MFTGHLWVTASDFLPHDEVLSIRLLVGCYHYIVFMVLVNTYSKSKLLVEEQFLLKRKIKFDYVMSLPMFYPSFLLLSIYSPPVNVQLKWLNALFWAYPHLMAKYIRKTMSLSTWKVKGYKLAPNVTALCTCNFVCTNMHAKPFYVHENQCRQILNLSSPVRMIIKC